MTTATMTNTTREFRCFGPPGTGKTTWLEEQIRRAVKRYHPSDVVVCSFTRAAAQELVSRDLPVPNCNVGTIHSLCYRALGSPTLIECNKGLVQDWNEAHPQWAIRGQVTLDEATPEENDQLLTLNRYRGQLKSWPSDFSSVWEEFKADHMAVDFTDLLEQAPRSLGAKVLFVDEAQDLTPLQWKVVRQWGAGMDVFIVAGDDDQLLYEFLGASPEPFLSELPPDRIKVRGKSWRLSRAVWEYAEKWIRQLGDRRQPKNYTPKALEGLVKRRPLNAKDPGPLVSEVADQAGDGRKVMVLASCSYMLRTIIEELKARGVPYHNPYRPRRGDWNPLRTTGQRITSFLECGRAVMEDRCIPAAFWRRWMEMVHSECFVRGTKRRLLDVPDDRLVRGADLEEWFDSDATARAVLTGDLDWLKRMMLDSWRARSAYPLSILERRGETTLSETPRVTVGTIHSVKGGEAEVVYVLPDLSYQSAKALKLDYQATHDSIVRMAYVAITRASDTAFLCAPSGRFAWEWL